jgi:hypothetical protein
MEQETQKMVWFATNSILIARKTAKAKANDGPGENGTVFRFLCFWLQVEARQHFKACSHSDQKF